MKIGIDTEKGQQLHGHLDTTPSQAKSILLVEYDQRLANILQQYMQAHGYHIETRLDPVDLENKLAKTPVDMVILDIGFIELTGLSIIKDIRRYFTGLLVLLTTRDSELEQITAFDFGADEYLVKPISANILSVRIGALFKRYDHAKIINDETAITVGDLILHPLANKCQQGQQEILLTQFEFKLLRLLAENVGKILSRDFIYKAILRREYNGCERTVDVRVSQLREKLTAIKQPSTYIETIWGQGYMLNIANNKETD